MENSQLKKRDLFREISLKAFTDEMKERPFTSREMIGCFLTYFFGFFKGEQVFAVFFDSGCRYSGLLHIQNGVLLVSSPIAESIEKKGKELGFRVLQFNAVVESNIHARHLYERTGFKQLGTIPNGFRMKDGSYANICPYFIEL